MYENDKMAHAEAAQRGGVTLGRGYENEKPVEVNVAAFNGQTRGALEAAHENVDQLLFRVRGAMPEASTDPDQRLFGANLMDQAISTRDIAQSLNVKLAELARFI